MPAAEARASRETAASALRAGGVAKSFGGKQVLRGVDLDVPRARSTVLVGPSSSGKSVLLKCLLGLLPPDEGEIHHGETNLAGLDEDARERLMRDVGVLFQQNALFDSLTVWENVAFALTHGRGMPRKEARQRALEALAAVGLQPAVADLNPAALSGGMQKRAALGRAIVTEPALLVLDDPTAGLDPILTQTILGLIGKVIERTGATALVVTSDMDVATGGFDRLAMLHQGRIVWQGEAREAAGSANAYVDQLVNRRGSGPIRMQVEA